MWTPLTSSSSPYAGTSERTSLSCFQVDLNPDSICSLAHFSDFFFFLAVSRPDSGNCHERDGSVQTTPHRDVITRLAQGLTICLCASKVISSFVMSLLNVPSTPFPPIFSSPAASPTPLAASPTPLIGIRLSPCAIPLWGGPSGHLADPIPN